MNKQEWLNRPLEVKVFDRCDHCGELKEGVKKRFWSNYSWYDQQEFTMVSCEPCYDAAVEKARNKPIYPTEDNGYD